MTGLETVELTQYDEPLPADTAARATRELERGNVLFFPRLAFTPADDEQHLLARQWADGSSKNIRYDPVTREIGHTSVRGQDRARLAGMLTRFAGQAQLLVSGVCPAYARGMRESLASFRPLEIRGRATSRRKDDSRLHIDAFASRPAQGQRILRVFCNVSPHGGARVWELGEAFVPVANRFRARVPPQLPLSAWLLARLGVTKQRRTPYDHIMLHLHDALKRDESYQRGAARVRIEFPAGSTWMLFSDCVLHAALAGRHALEQTFFVPVSAMLDPRRSPLLTLETMYGRKLA